MQRTAAFYTLSTLAITFLLPPGLFAQDEDRFRYFNNCEPISLDCA